MTGIITSLRAVFSLLSLLLVFSKVNETPAAVPLGLGPPVGLPLDLGGVPIFLPLPVGLPLGLGPPVGLPLDLGLPVPLGLGPPVGLPLDLDLPPFGKL